jgi:hypothetical protein
MWPHLFTVSISILFLSIASFANEAPFDPVFAADQKVITTATMESEMQQFRAISRWKASGARLDTAERKRDQAKIELDRIQGLFEKGQSTEANLNLAKFEYQNSVDRVTQIGNQLQHSKYDAIINRLKVLEDGNPGVDHRFEIAEASLQATKIELGNLEKNRDAATISQSYFETRFKNGKILFQKGVIAKAELERRELDYQNAVNQVQALDFEILSSRAAVKGLELSYSRLKKEFK